MLPTPSIRQPSWTSLASISIRRPRGPSRCPARAIPRRRGGELVETVVRCVADETSTSTTSTSTAAATTPAAADAGPRDRPPPLASRVRVVLVSPRTSSNVGAACRASSNHGVDDVVVVDPRCDVTSGSDAGKLSRDVAAFRGMRVVETLDQALEGTAAAVGVSRRTGGARRAAEGMKELLRAGVPGVTFSSPSPSSSSPSSPPPVVAFVFGREESGLTDEELRRCSGGCVALRTAPSAPSLNLAAAVAVTLALLQEEVASATREGEERGRATTSRDASPSSFYWPPPEDVAPAQTVDALVSRVAELAAALGLEREIRETAGGGGNHGRKLRTAGHFRNLATRGQVTRAECGALHALLRAAEQQLRACNE